MTFNDDPKKRLMESSLSNLNTDRLSYGCLIMSRTNINVQSNVALLEWEPSIMLFLTEQTSSFTDRSHEPHLLLMIFRH